MIEEIQKRPFVRPLFLWIAGILLYISFPTDVLGISFCLFCCLFLLLSCLFRKKVEHFRQYDCRWVWGALFSFMTLSLAVQVTYICDRTVFSPGETVGLYKIAADTQQALVDSFDRLSLSDGDKSVLATLTLGYKQSMSREMKMRFSLTGVSHILSVSGFHVAVVCGFLSFICSVLPRKGVGRWVRYILLMLSLWTFAFITGLAPSAIRAALMLSLYLTGQVLRRAGDGYNTLAAAAFCMLVYNPFYLFDIGFQLSYLAVLFILLLAPRLKKLIEVRNPLLAMPWEWITVSVAAQVGTALLCGFYFNQFPVLFLFTNIPITILASLLIPAALIWLALPVCFPGYGAIQWGIEAMIRAMVRVVEVFSEVPGAAMSVYLGLVEMLAGYLVLVLCIVYVRWRSPKVLLSALFLFLLLLLNILIQRFLLYR